MTRLPISHPLQLSCTIFSYLALKNVVTLRCHSRSLENLGDIFIRIPYGRMFSRFDIIHERDGQTPHNGVRRACAFIAQQNFYNLETLMLWTAGLNFVKLHIELSSWQIRHITTRGAPGTMNLAPARTCKLLLLLLLLLLIHSFYSAFSRIPRMSRTKNIIRFSRGNTFTLPRRASPVLTFTEWRASRQNYSRQKWPRHFMKITFLLQPSHK